MRTQLIAKVSPVKGHSHLVIEVPGKPFEYAANKFDAVVKAARLNHATLTEREPVEPVDVFEPKDTTKEMIQKTLAKLNKLKGEPVNDKPFIPPQPPQVRTCDLCGHEYSDQVTVHCVIPNCGGLVLPQPAVNPSLRAEAQDGEPEDHQ